jgi:hypothetical protein
MPKLLPITEHSFFLGSEMGNDDPVKVISILEISDLCPSIRGNELALLSYAKVCGEIILQIDAQFLTTRFILSEIVQRVFREEGDRKRKFESRAKSFGLTTEALRAIVIKHAPRV